ncbi:Hypothetical protein HDN1F_25860 [gamma proteobacterium HdN1]|nr:Hypothetical protein HDN1F_25860 [gamma proteobacterium HdN1]
MNVRHWLELNFHEPDFLGGWVMDAGMAQRAVRRVRKCLRLWVRRVVAAFAWPLAVAPVWAMALVVLAFGSAHACADQQVAVRVALALKAPIERGLVEVEAVGRYIVIRIPEATCFPTNAATLRPQCLPVLVTIRSALQGLEKARYTVAGHSDDVPINTARYSSNWEFAAARAGAVLVELLKATGFSADHFTLASYGPTRPLVANTSADNRARNRRVEVVVEL